MTTNPYLLSFGSHERAQDGRCAMEWVAYLAGEGHTDSPRCVSAALQEFCITLNDALPDEHRQRLRPYLARTIGTAGDGLDQARRIMAAGWMVRECAPAFLDLVPELRVHAAHLRATNDFDATTLDRNLPTRVELAEAEKAARDRGLVASRYSAPPRAAGQRFSNVAKDALADAGVPAARAVARLVSATTEPDVARDTALLAASDAVANKTDLEPAVTQLRNSILSPGGLLDRMLPTEALGVPVAADWREVCGV